MTGLALDQIAEHVVGDARAQAAERLAGLVQRLMEHQGHGIVELRGGGPQLQGQRVDIGAMQELPGQACCQGLGIVTLADSRGMGGGDDQAAGIDHEQLGDFRQMLVQTFQIGVAGEWPGLLQAGGDEFQCLPVLAGPIGQQIDSGAGQPREGLLDPLDLPGVEQTRPAHGQFAGLAEPGQPASLVPGEIHPITA